MKMIEELKGISLRDAAPIINMGTNDCEPYELAFQYAYYRSDETSNMKEFCYWLGVLEDYGADFDRENAIMCWGIKQHWINHKANKESKIANLFNEVIH